MPSASAPEHLEQVLPSRAGEGDTLIPAASMAAILDSASPLPPEMMAPAWPMRRPGGAVRPAMKPTMGFRPPRGLMAVESGGFSSDESADLADHDDRLGGLVGQKHLQHLDELGALDRIAADAHCGGLAETLVGGLKDRLVGERAGARHDTDLARLEDVARHDADLALRPPVITPGQLGPISRDYGPASARLTFTMSSTGMPSVMQTISGISAWMASEIASAAPAGGT